MPRDADVTPEQKAALYCNFLRKFCGTIWSLHFTTFNVQYVPYVIAFRVIYQKAIDKMVEILRIVLRNDTRSHFLLSSHSSRHGLQLHEPLPNETRGEILIYSDTDRTSVRKTAVCYNFNDCTILVVLQNDLHEELVRDTITFLCTTARQIAVPGNFPEQNLSAESNTQWRRWHTTAEKQPCTLYSDCFPTNLCCVSR